MAINGDVPQVQRDAPSTSSRRASWTFSWPPMSRAWSGCGTHQSRGKFRHPHRHRVLRPPHRTYRSRRTQRPGDFRHPRERYLLKSIEKATGESLTPMQLPTAGTSTAHGWRVSTMPSPRPLSAGDIDFYRDVVAHYVE